MYKYLIIKPVKLDTEKFRLRKIQKRQQQAFPRDEMHWKKFLTFLVHFVLTLVS